MDIGRHAIARALKDQDLQPFLDAGMDLFFLRKDESAAVFEGQTVRAWEFILRKNAEHGRVPPKELFEKEFPAPSFRLPADPLLPSEIIELAVTETRRVVITSAQIGIQDVLTRNDFEQGDVKGVSEAAEILKRAAEQLGEEGISEACSLPTATIDDLDSMPEPEFLIRGAVDEGTVFMLAGKKGLGKSFLALDWALCVATGNSWMEEHEVRQGHVIYVAAEGFRGLQKRSKAWRERYGKVDRRSITFVTKPVNLGSDEDVRKLAALIKSTDASLVIFDTLARCSVGVEENSAKEMGEVIDRLFKLRDAIEECGTTIGVVHHSGYGDNRARGSSALEAGLDGVLQMEGEDPHNLVTLKCTKRKDDDPFGPRYLKLKLTGPSCVLEGGSEIDGPSGAAKKPVKEQIYDLLDEENGLREREIIAELESNQPTVNRNLKQLEEEGRAERRNSGRRGAAVWTRRVDT